jgi:hypothetical protein
MNPMKLYRCAVAVAGVASWVIFVGNASAFEIVSWDISRGGNASLADSSDYASTREMIATHFPGTTIVGVPAITSAALSGANVVWIGSTFDNVDAVTALSPSEQSALTRFVDGGGMAVLFADNDSFTSNANAQETNDSIMNPFGISTTGTLPGTQDYTLLNPSSYPLTGPFGAVGSLSSAYPGWFGALPGTASIIADLSSNGEPIIATLPPGALEAGSGRVWLFSDSGEQSDGGIQGGDWNTLYANILAPVPEPSSLAMLGISGLALLRRRRNQFCAVN